MTIPIILSCLVFSIVISFFIVLALCKAAGVADYHLEEKEKEEENEKR